MLSCALSWFCALDAASFCSDMYLDARLMGKEDTAGLVARSCYEQQKEERDEVGIRSSRAPTTNESNRRREQETNSRDGKRVNGRLL